MSRVMHHNYTHSPNIRSARQRGLHVLRKAGHTLQIAVSRKSVLELSLHTTPSIHVHTLPTAPSIHVHALPIAPSIYVHALPTTPSVHVHALPTAPSIHVHAFPTATSIHKKNNNLLNIMFSRVESGVEWRMVDEQGNAS